MIYSEKVRLKSGRKVYLVPQVYIAASVALSTAGRLGAGDGTETLVSTGVLKHFAVVRPALAGVNDFFNSAAKNSAVRAFKSR